MSDPAWVTYGRKVVEEALANLDGWADIVVDLRAIGLEDEEIRLVLREQQAWIAEAREWKRHGFPYDAIITELREELLAEWGDVARALMEVGLSPADMLRTVLPLTEESELTPVVQAALLDGSEDADYQEAREVLGFFKREEDLIGVVDLDGVQREIVVQRLGLSR
jgi:hypothetical protein